MFSNVSNTEIFDSSGASKIFLIWVELDKNAHSYLATVFIKFHHYFYTFLQIEIFRYRFHKDPRKRVKLLLHKISTTQVSSYLIKSFTTTVILRCARNKLKLELQLQSANSFLAQRSKCKIWSDHTKTPGVHYRGYILLLVCDP